MSSPEQGLITRSRTEVYGRHVGYGFAGLGVSTAIGNYTQTAVDLSFPGGMLGLLNWTRTYNSLSEDAGPLGRGWTTAFSARLVPEGQSGPVTFHDEDGRVLTFIPDGDGYRRPQDLDADLARHQDGTFTLAFSFGESWSFDAEGRLTGRSREGQSAVVDRDDQGRPVRVTHTSGRSLTLSYSDANRLATLDASDGRVVTYTYTGAGDLESATIPGGGVTRTETNSDGRITRVTDPDGNLVVASTYDGDGRVARQDFPGGDGADFAYDDAAGLTTVTSTPGNARVLFQANADGRLIKVTDPAGNAATFDYDEGGRLAAAVSPGGTRLTQAWDGRGNLLSSTWDGATTAYGYDDHDRPASETDPAGSVTRYEYEGGSYIPTQVTDPLGNITRFTVSGGLITGRTDAEGAVTSYEYDTAGNLISMTDPLGQETRYSYDEVGNQTRSVAPSGATTSLTYDDAGRVTSRTDPGGATTSFRYSDAGLPLEITDPAGAVTSYTYDAAGNRTGITDPLGRTAGFGYDADGNLVTVTGLGGEITNATYDELGRTTSVTDPIGATYRFTYDADGNRVTEEAPSGTIRTAYDARGNPVSVTDASGAETRYEYDLADRQTAVTTPDGATWRTSYDAAGQPVTVTDPLGGVTRRQWTPAGNLSASIDPLGRVTSYTRDKTGRVVAVTNPEGGVTRYVYDGDGRRVSVTTPSGLTTRFERDAAGRVSAMVDPRGWITRYEYNSRGDKIAVIRPSGAVRRHRYNAADELTEVIDANGSVTRYGYDAAGHLSVITDAKGAVTRLAHDPNGRQTSSTDPLGRTTKREYDQSGNLIAVTDPSGGTVRMGYDKNNRLIRRQAGDEIITFGYDSAGRETSMTDGTGTTHYAYDKAGRPVKITYPDGDVIAMSYDAAGQRTALTYPSGLELSYSYNLNGRLTGLYDPRAGHAAYALDPDGRLLTEQLPRGEARRYHYQDGLLGRFEVFRKDHPVAVTSFTHDPDGRILTQREGHREREYRYDPAGQLIYTGWREEDDRDSVHITYDVVGNRIRLRRGDIETRYRYDAADQLLGIQVHGRHHDRHLEFRYDSSGRLTEKIDGGRRYTVDYDGFGLPVTVTRHEPEYTERVGATFNGNGLVTSLVLSTQSPYWEREKSASVWYTWSAGRVPQILAQRAEPRLEDAEHDRPGRLDADFAYGYGRTFASWRHGGATFHRDAHGSAVRTPETGPWVQADRYDTFGEPEETEPRESDEAGYERSEPEGHRLEPPEFPRFGYRGELGLGRMLYLRARVYDTELGRFTARDPVTAHGGPSHAGNPYTYAGNDPLNYADPLGTLRETAGLLFDGAESFLQVYAPAAPGGCGACRNPGNSITRHSKCFWNHCLRTRGYFNFAPRALYADPAALNAYWNRGPRADRERAAHGFTIAHLDWNREGFGSSLGHIFLGRDVPVSQNVDWEVSVPAGAGQRTGGRFDILTETQHLLEVKEWQGPSTVNEVETQLNRYVSAVRSLASHTLTKSTELQEWADAFYVIGSVTWKIFVSLDLVYVWGLGNRPGHIYFAKGDKTDDRVKQKVYEEHWLQELLGTSPIPVPGVRWYQIPRAEPLGPGGGVEDPEPEPVPEIPAVP